MTSYCMTKKERLLDSLEKLSVLAMEEHYYCDDSWYSCPLAPDGCSNDNEDKGKCTCGATEHNIEVTALISEIVKEILR